MTGEFVFLFRSTPSQEELANRVMAHPEGSVFSKHVAWWVELPTISVITLCLQKGWFCSPWPPLSNIHQHGERTRWAACLLVLLCQGCMVSRMKWECCQMLRYILDRKHNFPNSPLPSSSWVRKTYDSCVADPHDMECKYPQVGPTPMVVPHTG